MLLNWKIIINTVLNYLKEHGADRSLAGDLSAPFFYYIYCIMCILGYIKCNWWCSKMEKYKLTLIRKDNKILNPYQLSQLITDYGTESYKLDLIKGLSLLLKKEVELSNIIILDKSLKKLGFKYRNLKLTNGNHLNALQAIGKPISMGYNSVIYDISLILELYNFCNTRLKKNLKPNILSLAYEKIKAGDELEPTLELIINNAIQSYANNKRSSVFVNDLENKKLELLSKAETYLKLYFKPERDEELRDKFFNKLEKLKRPLLGILNGDKIGIIKFEHLNLRGEPAVDFKRIEHNSPLELDPLSPLGLAKTTVEVFMAYQHGKELIKSEQERQRTEQILQEYLKESMINETRKTDAIIEKIRESSKDKYDEISTSESVKLIPNVDLRERAARAYGNQTHQMAKFKNKYNVELKNFDISC